MFARFAAVQHTLLAALTLLLLRGLAACSSGDHAPPLSESNGGGGAAGASGAGGAGGTGGASGAGGAGGSGGASGAAGSSGAAGAGGSVGCINAQNGPAPVDRYELLDEGTFVCNDPAASGTGRIKDKTTTLVWDRFPFHASGGIDRAAADSLCKGQGARLPTKQEALGISGKSYDSCAWPCGWGTWVSDLDSETIGTYVRLDGTFGIYEITDTQNDDSLCVR